MPQVAVVIPCYNEALTVGKVVCDLCRELPHADIYVYDNNSVDGTANVARAAGATVRHEGRQGKGYVVQTMLRDIEADILVMVDGDDTYPAADVHKLLAPVLEGTADMVVGARLHQDSQSEFNATNLLGNHLFRAAVRFCFKSPPMDILSGYRAFTADFIRGVPLFSGGFDVETELTIKALQGGYRIVEVPISTIARKNGSQSKIRHGRDGMIILGMILALFRDYRPLTFFGGAGLLLVLLAFIPGSVVIVEYLRTGFVLRMPSAVLATAMVLAGMVLGAVGLILHAMARRFQELNYILRRAIEHSSRSVTHYTPDKAR